MEEGRLFVRDALLRRSSAGKVWAWTGALLWRELGSEEFDRNRSGFQGWLMRLGIGIECCCLLYDRDRLEMCGRWKVEERVEVILSSPVLCEMGLVGWLVMGPWRARALNFGRV